MKNIAMILRFLAILALLTILVVSVLYSMNKLIFESYKIWLLTSSLAWFAAMIASSQVIRTTNPPE